MERSFTAIIIAISIFVSGTALADQLAWLPTTGPDVEKINMALTHLKTGDIVYSYCAPCSDNSATAITVRNVSISIPQPGYKELFVNGEGIDLAYIYVKSNEGYSNLGILSGYAPEQVPTALPDNVMKSIK